MAPTVRCVQIEYRHNLNASDSGLHHTVTTIAVMAELSEGSRLNIDTIDYVLLLLQTIEIWGEKGNTNKDKITFVAPPPRTIVRINKLESIVKQQQDKLSDQEKTIIRQQQAMTEQHELYKTLQNMYNKQAGTIKRHENIMYSQAARILSLERDTDLSSIEARTSNTSIGPGKDWKKHKTGTDRGKDKRTIVNEELF
ncbi:hypothetical protein DPMN_046555 [Dreissena polymorpha]|uniref:Uncharacterized protein n=1 Tax=Dreissena polymorpha TaxID=45954 RepID=A0A9D4D802_DREPO|nr:hypothetical protein DPMN_046555 [Dreissena polymorpha]